jgi:hypothetical protein
MINYTLIENNLEESQKNLGVRDSGLGSGEFQITEWKRREATGKRKRHQAQRHKELAK